MASELRAAITRQKDMVNTIEKEFGTKMSVLGKKSETDEKVRYVYDMVSSFCKTQLRGEDLSNLSLGEVLKRGIKHPEEKNSFNLLTVVVDIHSEWERGIKELAMKRGAYNLSDICAKGSKDPKLLEDRLAAQLKKEIQEMKDKSFDDLMRSFNESLAEYEGKIDEKHPQYRYIGLLALGRLLFLCDKTGGLFDAIKVIDDGNKQTTLSLQKEREVLTRRREIEDSTDLAEKKLRKAEENMEKVKNGGEKPIGLLTGVEKAKWERDMAERTLIKTELKDAKDTRDEIGKVLKQINAELENIRNIRTQNEQKIKKAKLVVKDINIREKEISAAFMKIFEALPEDSIRRVDFGPYGLDVDIKGISDLGQKMATILDERLEFFRQNLSDYPIGPKERNAFVSLTSFIVKNQEKIRGFDKWNEDLDFSDATVTEPKGYEKLINTAQEI